MRTTRNGLAPRYRLAFVSDRDGDDEIFVMYADGSNVRQLTHNQATDREPAWSPDGFLLAFTGDGDGDNEIFVVDADRGHPVQLTHNDYDDRDPTWMPAGE